MSGIKEFIRAYHKADFLANMFCNTVDEMLQMEVEKEELKRIIDEIDEARGEKKNV